MIEFKRTRYGDMAYLPHDAFVGKSLHYYGEYSEDEVDLFRHLVQPGATVLEIGANIGAHTLPLAQMAGPAGRVHAFEPQRMLYYCLCANVVVNNLLNVICHQAAVGASAGTIQVPEIDYSKEFNFGGVGLETPYECACYGVPLVRIDDVPCARCDFIKIDAEGMELRVLEGARETIATFRPFLYLEDDPRAGRSAELHQFLEQLGYECYPHLPGFFNPDNFAENEADLFANSVSRNLLCRPRESAMAVNEHVFSARATRRPFALGCNMQGMALFRQGQIEASMASFERALRWEPEAADALINLGVVLDHQGRTEESAESFLRALAKEPRRKETWNRLADIGKRLHEEKNLDAAAICFQKMLDAQADPALAHNCLGIILCDQGRADEALMHFEEAVRLQPDYVEARSNLAAAGELLAKKLDS